MEQSCFDAYFCMALLSSDTLMFHVCLKTNQKQQQKNTFYKMMQLYLLAMVSSKQINTILHLK